MASVSGVYLYCIWKLNLNEYQNGILEDWYKDYHEVKYFQDKHTQAIWKNEQVPKSPWKNTDRKGANTFPFYNLPPVLKNILEKGFFLFFFLFRSWMK